MKKLQKAHEALIREDARFVRVSEELAQIKENYQVCKQILLQTLNVKLSYESIIQKALQVKEGGMGKKMRKIITQVRKNTKELEAAERRKLDQ